MSAAEAGLPASNAGCESPAWEAFLGFKRATCDNRERCPCGVCDGLSPSNETVGDNE